jgi:6-phosphogluconolactonase
MKFSKLSQLFLVSAIGLLVATLLSSCEIVTIDYIFVASSSGSGASSTGQIQTYDADSETGALRSGQPAVPSGGTNPVSMAVTSDYANLYVANAGNSSVVHFALNGNGVLTQKDLVTAISTPTSIAINAANTYLYVVSGTTSATLTEYSLSNGVIGSVVAQIQLTVPGFAGDTMIPTAVTILANDKAVYVAAYDQSAYNPGCTPYPACITSSAHSGWVFGYAVGSGGALTAASGSPWQAGIRPSALVADPTSRFVYVTDFASSELIGYSIQSGSVLDSLLDSPFGTGTEPAAITIDPRGKYIYVANSLGNTVSAYSIDPATGDPTGVANITGSAADTTDTQPLAVLVDAALGRFVYTANRLGNDISGFEINTDTGAMSPTQATPYPTGANPVAILSVPHGNHAIQSTTP